MERRAMEWVLNCIVSPRIADEGLLFGVTCHWCGARRGQCPHVADISLL